MTLVARAELGAGRGFTDGLTNLPYGLGFFCRVAIIDSHAALVADRQSDSHDQHLKDHGGLAQFW